MIKFFIMADRDISVLAYNMTKFMNSVTRNGGVIISSNVIKDLNPLLTGVVFYSETKRERINNSGNDELGEKVSGLMINKIVEDITQK